MAAAAPKGAQWRMACCGASAAEPPLPSPGSPPRAGMNGACSRQAGMVDAWPGADWHGMAWRVNPSLEPGMTSSYAAGLPTCTISTWAQHRHHGRRASGIGRGARRQQNRAPWAASSVSERASGWPNPLNTNHRQLAGGMAMCGATAAAAAEISEGRRRQAAPAACMRHLDSLSPSIFNSCSFPEGRGALPGAAATCGGPWCARAPTASLKAGMRSVGLLGVGWAFDSLASTPASSTWSGLLLLGPAPPLFTAAEVLERLWQTIGAASAAGPPPPSRRRCSAPAAAEAAPAPAAMAEEPLQVSSLWAYDADLAEKIEEQEHKVRRQHTWVLALQAKRLHPRALQESYAAGATCRPLPPQRLHARGWRLALLAFSTLGVVYGDIGARLLARARCLPAAKCMPLLPPCACALWHCCCCRGGLSTWGAT